MYSLGIDNHDQCEEEDEERVLLKEVVVPHHSYHCQLTRGGKQTTELEKGGRVLVTAVN